MLSRLLPKPSNLRLLTFISSKSQVYSHNPNHFISLLKPFSTNNNNGDPPSSSDDIWKFSRETDEKFDHLFTRDDAGPADFDAGSGSRRRPEGEGGWMSLKDEGGDDVFKGVEREIGEKGDGNFGSDEWETAAGYKPWSLTEEEKGGDVFGIGEGGGVKVWEKSAEELKREEEEKARLEIEERELAAVLKGPNRAFGDLVAASGITDAMLDSLIALKDFEDVEGLPPLREIEDWRYEKTTRKSSRAEMERQKQEEVAKTYVRQVDDKGRAYGTGRRKCSVARVWIEPGEGKFVVNEKEFDVYFPMLDHRAALLRPFAETKTLGLWDIKCTVQGGGVTGQVGAIQLGVSRALQNWEPDLRPVLRNGGFLTRDPRVVERKKPGKAKARKSFQWVKR